MTIGWIKNQPKFKAVLNVYKTIETPENNENARKPLN